MIYNSRLDRNVADYCAKVVKNHNKTIKHRDILQEWIRYQQHNGVQCPSLHIPAFWDWPAVVVACSDQNRMICDFTRGVRAKHVVDPLYSKLMSLGGVDVPREYVVDGRRHFSKNMLGRCAEQHAANEIYKKGSHCQLNQLQFSKAFRPRTGEEIAYCDNCQLIFS